VLSRVLAVTLSKMVPRRLAVAQSRLVDLPRHARPRSCRSGVPEFVEERGVRDCVSKNAVKEVGRPAAPGGEGPHQAYRLPVEKSGTKRNRGPAARAARPHAASGPVARPVHIEEGNPGRTLDLPYAARTGPTLRKRTARVIAIGRRMLTFVGGMADFRSLEVIVIFPLL